MKKAIYFSLILPFLFSCHRIPSAGFHTDTINPVVGQEVFFYNDSHHADRFEWDFGDGYISNESDPTHIYQANGIYDVTLKAISKNNEDNTSLTLNVMIPTLLEIQVMEYFDQYVVPDASVRLYPTLADWDAETNIIYEGFTDANGTVVFSDLEPFVDYVDVWEQNHDNYSLRDEDPGFVTTPQIVPNQINRFIAWVDYVPHTTKGAARGTRSLVIRKLERKTADTKQIWKGPAETWQDLYNRRANKK